MSEVNNWTLSDAEAIPKWDFACLRPYAFVSGIYILATLLTRPFSQGDTPDYVDSIVTHINGGYYQFWDFGHLLWRPFGWLLFHISGSFLGRFIGANQRAEITLGLIVVSWLAGLGCALLLLALLRLYCARAWIPELVVASFIFSSAALNYSQSGSSYISGLCLLTLSVYVIARETVHPSGSVTVLAIAGLALAGSVSLWFLYVLAVPGAIVLPIASGLPYKSRCRLSIGLLLFFGFSIALAYIPVLVHLRLSNVSRVMSWVSASSHGIRMGGLARAIFGWPRSMIDMGDAGPFIKRYLLHDPFNPVTFRDLFQLWPELAMIGLFYLSLLGIIIHLRRFSDRRRILLVSLAGMLPVLGFAIHWTGAALERFFPLGPFFFLALCIVLADPKAIVWTKWIGWTFVVCVILTNAVNLRSAVALQAQTQSESRIQSLVPRLKNQSLIIVVQNIDDLVAYNRNFPFSAINRAGTLNLYTLVTPGNSDVPMWKENFASHALRTWKAGGDVWISNRVFRAKPQAEWKWVQGDDSRIVWPDFAAFFSRFQYGESVGGDDGFTLLVPSAENQSSLHLLDSHEFVMIPADLPPHSRLAKKQAATSGQCRFDGTSRPIPYSERVALMEDHSFASIAPSGNNGSGSSLQTSFLFAFRLPGILREQMSA